MMSTLSDVAKMANVSIATVSNYLNHTHPVSAQREARIKEAIENLHYVPNTTARTLKKKSANDIGVILPNLQDSYYNQIYEGIKSVFSNTSYNLRIQFSEDIPAHEKKIAQNFISLNVNGLILISCQPENWEFYRKYYSEQGCPIVAIDRMIKDLNCNFVSFDNRNIMRSITTAIIQKKINRPFLFTGSLQFSNEQSFVKGFQDAMRDAGLKISSYQIIATDLSKEHAFSKMISLLNHDRPQAVITTSESLAVGVLEAMSFLGYSKTQIPIYSLGEDKWNIYTRTFSSFSYCRPAINLGKKSAQMLLDQLEQPYTKENEHVILPGGELSCSLSGHEFPADYSSVFLPAPMTDIEIHALMLDTPQVHSLINLLPNFVRQTGIHVDVQIEQHNNLYKRIVSNRQQNSDEFDIYMYDLPWLRTFAYQKVLLDITDEMSRIDPSVFFPNCFDYYSLYRKHYYGIPFMYATQILYYRKDLFDDKGLNADYRRKSQLSLRPPITFKEYNTVAEFFTESSACPYGISVPTAYSECLIPEIYMRLFAYRGRVFDDNCHVTLNSMEALNAYINFIQSIEAAKPNFRTATDSSVVQDFLNGETAMLITYPSFFTDNALMRQKSITGTISYHIIPGRHPLLGGWGLGINSLTQKKEAALRFLEWTANINVANYSTVLGSNYAITSTYTNDELNNLYPWLKLCYSMYPQSHPTLPPILENGVVIPEYSIETVLAENIKSMLNKEMSVEETLSKSQYELEILFEKYKNA